MSAGAHTSIEYCHSNSISSSISPEYPFHLHSCSNLHPAWDSISRFTSSSRLFSHNLFQSFFKLTHFVARKFSFHVYSVHFFPQNLPHLSLIWWFLVHFSHFSEKRLQVKFPCLWPFLICMTFITAPDSYFSGQSRPSLYVQMWSWTNFAEPPRPSL